MPSNTTIVLIVATLTYSVLAKAGSAPDATQPVPVAISVQQADRGGDSRPLEAGYDLGVNSADAPSLEALDPR